MEIIIKKFNELEKEELYEILHERSEVFVMEQEILYNDLDKKDYNSYHLMVKKAEKIIGYLRIIEAGISYDEISIGRVLVVREFRGKKIAREMLNKAIGFVEKNLKEEKITISAQFYLKKFYESLGFTAISNMYIEEGIEHIKMKYEK